MSASTSVPRKKVIRSEDKVREVGLRSLRGFSKDSMSLCRVQDLGSAAGDGRLKECVGVDAQTLLCTVAIRTVHVETHRCRKIVALLIRSSAVAQLSATAWAGGATFNRKHAPDKGIRNVGYRTGRTSV